MDRILQEALFYGYLFFVSLLFWLKDTAPLKYKIYSSVHGLSVLVIFGIAYLIFLSGIINSWMQYLYIALFIFPLASIICSLLYFKGNKVYLVLHIFTLLAMVWVCFVGLMLVTHQTL